MSNFEKEEQEQLKVSEFKSGNTGKTISVTLHGEISTFEDTDKGLARFREEKGDAFYDYVFDRGWLKVKVDSATAIRIGKMSSKTEQVKSINRLKKAIYIITHHAKFDWDKYFKLGLCTVGLISLSCVLTYLVCLLIKSFPEV